MSYALAAGSVLKKRAYEKVQKDERGDFRARTIRSMSHVEQNQKPVLNISVEGMWQ